MDNTCVNSSIVCAKDTGTASVRYFGESHLGTLMPLGLMTEFSLQWDEF